MNRLKSYWKVFQISWSEHLVYRTNFLLWRLRVLMGFVILYFFWFVVFASQQQVFGYTKADIFTYILLSSILRSMVLSSRSADVAGEILQGGLTNFLLKPISYFTYWWARDIADKALNLIFTFFELTVLFLLLRPPLFLQTNPFYIVLFVLAAALSMILYFYFSLLISLLAFWLRETWSIRFLTMVVLDFLSGAGFPLDILPRGIFKILELLPFGYLMFFPNKIFLGQLATPEIIRGLMIVSAWVGFMYFAVLYTWQRGLRVYSGEGR